MRPANTLPQLSGPFDLVFIDADKENIPEYFSLAIKLCRPGSLLVVDNVVREGEVANSGTPDREVQAVRRLAQMIADDTRMSATVIQMVGMKGHDGFLAAAYLG